MKPQDENTSNGVPEEACENSIAYWSHLLKNAWIQCRYEILSRWPRYWKKMIHYFLSGSLGVPNHLRGITHLLTESKLAECPEFKASRGVQLIVILWLAVFIAGILVFPVPMFLRIGLLALFLVMVLPSAMAFLKQYQSARYYFSATHKTIVVQDSQGIRGYPYIIVWQTPMGQLIMLELSVTHSRFLFLNAHHFSVLDRHQYMRSGLKRRWKLKVQ